MGLLPSSLRSLQGGAGGQHKLQHKILLSLPLLALSRAHQKLLAIPKLARQPLLHRLELALPRPLAGKSLRFLQNSRIRGGAFGHPQPSSRRR